MKISEVSKDEMKACADLINFLKVSELHLKMNQAEILYKAVSWLQSLAKQMLTADTEPEAVSAPDLSNAVMHRAKKK